MKFEKPFTTRTVASLVVFAFLLAGCAASVQTTNEESYRQSSFTEESLKEEGLAVLPIVSEEGVEGYRRPFGRAVNGATERLLGTENALGWQATMDRLNSEGLATDYNEAIAAYQRTSVIDQSLTEKMREACNRRYFLYIRLSSPKSQTRQAESEINEGGTYQQKFIGVGAIGQIWDARTGDVVWEGTGKSSVARKAEMTYIKDKDIETYSQNAAQALVRGIFDMPATGESTPSTSTDPEQQTARSNQVQTRTQQTPRSSFGVRLGRDFSDIEKFSLGIDALHRLQNRSLFLNPTLDYYFLGESSATGIYRSVAVSTHIVQMGGNVVYPFQVERSSLQPYAGGGLALNFLIAEAEANSVFGGTGSASETEVGLGVNFLGGMNYMINQEMQFFAEAQYTPGLGDGLVGELSFFSLRSGLRFSF